MKSLVLFALLLSSSGILAAELSPAMDGERLGANIRGIGFPATFSRDLKSGLTNRILIRVTLLTGSPTHRHSAVDIAVQYDLWDERFALTMTVNDRPIAARSYRTTTDIIAFLSDLRLADLFATDALNAGDELTLQAEVLFNPIDKERMEKIRKWVTENSAYVPLEPGAAGGAPAGPTANAIFNRIFEQYASGSDVAAIWKDSASSKPFRLEDLHRDRP